MPRLKETASTMTSVENGGKDSCESGEVLLKLPAKKESVAAARQALDELLEVCPTETLDDLRLLVSELVTNSIRHTGLGSQDLIELRVEWLPRLVRVEVADKGPGFERRPSRAVSERGSGWGLFLVERISDRWGLHVDNGTRVWFEMDLALA